MIEELKKELEYLKTAEKLSFDSRRALDIHIQLCTSFDRVIKYFEDKKF